MDNTDILFLSEAHGRCTALPQVPGFTLIGDPAFPLLSAHGGQAAYIRDELFTHTQDIRFSKCTLSFKLDMVPNFAFMGVYMYPNESYNFSELDFGILSSDIAYWLNKAVTPFIGGDLNCRIGDLNMLSSKSLRWRYDTNVDTHTNEHYKSLESICEIHKILPINHCKYYNLTFDGYFTYFKGGKKSQIDLLLTNNQGRRVISSFTVVKEDWHMSDHLPIVAKLKIPCVVDSNTLLVRSNELKPFVPSQHPLLKVHRYKFDLNSASQILQDKSNNLVESCRQITNNPDEIINLIEESTIPIIKECKYSYLENNTVASDDPKEQMLNCNRLFDAYIVKLDDASCNDEELAQSYSDYQSERNKLTCVTFEEHEKTYQTILNSKDDKKLWDRINWSGTLKQGNSKSHPPVSELAEHFKDLYQPQNDENIQEIIDLKSDVYNPATDDPITLKEMSDASKLMKKGGWDYSLSVLNLLITKIPLCVLHLMNIIFFFCYPIKLSLSLLHAIPKKGNLRLVTNFRGIQMQPLLGLLYDRIIALRLILWAKINPEQSAFQKGKGTLDQIFTIRVIIALARRYKKSLFIGVFDLSKAFDKVSRIELLKSLIKLGIGATILEAIKATYIGTRCVLKSAGKLSEIFSTFSGIKQGAPSSVILFIIFMDDIIDTLKDKCLDEIIIKNLHCLLHADDTLVMSFSLELFVSKCNALVNALHAKKLVLNLSKSSYMVINPPIGFVKVDLKIVSGWLPYEASMVYLGALITDSGLISSDVILQARMKDKGVTVKLANFITNNLYSPVTVKLKILTTCISSAILYSCETWGSSSLAKVDALHKKAIRTALSFKTNVPNEVVYTESGLLSLKGAVYSRQYKFWSKILKDIENNPNSPISTLYKQAIDCNLLFISHYVKLHQKFSDATKCKEYYDNLSRNSMIQQIRIKAAGDEGGIYDTYLKVNPSLECPTYYKSYSCKEYERLIVSKYRTGGHRLKIQTGRREGVVREERFCKCKNEVQTLKHVIFRCQLTERMRDNNFNVNNLDEFFRDTRNAAEKLRVVEKILKVK